MFLRSIKTAFRYINNHRQFTLINVLGLTLGFYCYFLLNAYVLKEKSFDSEHKFVYRLLQKSEDENGNTREIAGIAAQVGSESKAGFEGIEAMTQVCYIGRIHIGNDPASTIHEHVAVMDTGFTNVFQFPLIEGNKEDLTQHTEGLILTNSSKQLFFGDQPAVGKTLKTTFGEYPIIAVLQDFPENSHFENMVFITSSVIAKVNGEWNQMYANDWSSNSFITYFKLQPKTNPSYLAANITEMAKKRNVENHQYNSSFFLQAVQDIHLYPNKVEGEINKNKGNAFYVGLFFWISIFILLVACFNYAGLLNISFMDRSKEIGLRQTAGASRLQLLGQFLSESLLLTLLSIGLAYALILLTSPLILQSFGTSIELFGLPVQGILVTMLIGVFTSVAATIYPFWLIVRSSITSSFSHLTTPTSKLPFRKFMLVFQFIAVIAFITASIVFNRQLQFLKNKELGFEISGLATIDINSGIMRDKFKAIKEEFLRLPEVQEVSVASRVPGEWKKVPMAKVNTLGGDANSAKDMLFIKAEKDFLPTFQMQLLQGENFSDLSSDSSSVLLNKSAVTALGLQEPIGKVIQIPLVNYGGETYHLENTFTARVKGVVEDFQMEDFRTAVKPMVIGNWNCPVHNIDYYALRIKSADWSKTIADLQAVNDSFDPDTPMEFHILNDKFSRFYEADILRYKLLNLFSGIIIFLACMGLFTMSAFVARSRLKEIGIRKVLGSTLGELMVLLSKDFVRLMLIGMFISAPITWYLIQLWLSDFAYHINVQWWMIALSGAGCLLLTLLTVSFQSIKAALVNPVKSLRAE